MLRAETEKNTLVSEANVLTRLPPFPSFGLGSRLFDNDVLPVKMKCRSRDQAPSSNRERVR